MQVASFADIETEFMNRVQRIVWCAVATVDRRNSGPQRGQSDLLARRRSCLPALAREAMCTRVANRGSWRAE